jgi:hypothetical protein
MAGSWAAGEAGGAAIVAAAAGFDPTQKIDGRYQFKR